MSAWLVENRWDSTYAARFRYSVTAGVGRHSGSKSRFTCEDLALQLIIDFASSHKLPLRIRNGSWSGVYVPADYDSLADYRLDVMTSTGARDLLLAGNTVAVGSDAAGRESDLVFAQVGDMIVMDYGEHGHVQVITQVRSDTIDIAQGNFPDPDWYCSGGGTDDPTDKCYLGVPIQRARYEMRDGRWRYTRGHDELVYQTRHARIRRWDFMSWNPKPVDPRSRMLVGPEGRPGRRW
jgi:CHAP domain-containing protein